MGQRRRRSVLLILLLAVFALAPAFAEFHPTALAGNCYIAITAAAFLPITAPAATKTSTRQSSIRGACSELLPGSAGVQLPELAWAGNYHNRTDEPPHSQAITARGARAPPSFPLS
jgi:hypothetical protein